MSLGTVRVDCAQLMPILTANETDGSMIVYSVILTFIVTVSVVTATTDLSVLRIIFSEVSSSTVSDFYISSKV